VVHWTTNRSIYYLHVEQFLALYALMGGFFGYVGTADMLFASISDCMEDYGSVVDCEVGSIPEKLLRG
jgi:hypothetical protein